MKKSRKAIASLAAFASAAGLDITAGAPVEGSPTPPALHPLGAKPSTVKVAAPEPMMNNGVTALPLSVDLSAWAPPVADQGHVGSCVTWAINYGLMGWQARKEGHAGTPFAPMYTYTQINGGQDSGSWPTDALDVAKMQGSDTQADYPQGNYNWSSTPTAAQHDNAQHYRIKGYTVHFSGGAQGQAGVTAIKTQLAAGHPVAITIPVRHGFDYMPTSTAQADTDTTSPIRGYHEIFAIGYNSTGLLIQNSWGTGWGAAGRGRLGWNVVANDVQEAETIDGFAKDGTHDLTGDGTSDVIARNAYGTLSIYPGTANGTGKFQAPRTVGAFGAYNKVLVSKDFDMNGSVDLFARKPDGTLYLYSGRADGTFDGPKQVGTGWGQFKEILAPGDFNGDHKADLIAEKTDGTLWLYPGNGNAGFMAPTQIGHGWGSMLAILAPGDFDGDGNSDLIAEQADGKLLLYAGKGNGAFYPNREIGHGWNIMNAIAAPGDIDGDGKADLVARKTDGTLWLYAGTGTGTFRAPYLQIGSGWNGMNIIA